MPHTAINVFRTARVNGSIPLFEWLECLKEREPRAYYKCLQRILLLSQLR